jgi:hypothetical protein
MSPAGPFIVMTGLPASGKSSLGRHLAEHLSLALIDKDEFLEAAFAECAAVSVADRSRLSRAADSAFMAAARSSHSAVLSSHWRWPGADEASGTPSEWLLELPGVVVEVYCRCGPAVAAHRFVERQRHPAHHDERFSEAELVDVFTKQAARGPLRVGRLLIADTDGHLDVPALVSQVRHVAASSQWRVSPAGLADHLGAR